MFGREETLNLENSKPKNINKFHQILKDNTIRNRNQKQKPQHNLKNITEELNNTVGDTKKKVKFMDSSYQSAKRSKNDPLLFKFKDDSEMNSLSDEEKNENDNNLDQKPLILNINNNLIEDHRKYKHEQKKIEVEQKLKIAKLEEEKLRVQKEKEDEKLRVQKIKEEEKIRGEKEKDAKIWIEKEKQNLEKLTLQNEKTSIIKPPMPIESSNRIIITGELKDEFKGSENFDPILNSRLLLRKQIDEQMDLLIKRKDNNFKYNNIIDLLETESQFSPRRDREIDNEKRPMLLNHIDKADFERKSHIEIIKQESLNKDNNILNTKYSANKTDFGEDQIKPMHLDAYNKFYKSDFYKNELFKEEVEKENTEVISNQDLLLFKSRLIYNYFNEKTNISLPKFNTMSEKERKCKEIIGLSDMKVEDKVKSYYDSFYCLKFRKFYARIASYISLWCHFIVNNPIFDNISLAVILANTLLILISDPTDTDSIANVSDNYFLYIYSFEMFLKIFAYGFVIPEGAYIKDMWNILDFIVIVVGWISFVLEQALSGNKISGLAGLRAFRILRPLKTVKSIKGLRSLIVTLIESMMALSDTAIVLFFFFLIFSIAGVQMWQGLCLRRCMSLNYGYFYDFSNYTTACTFDDDCSQFNQPGNKFICAKSYINPNNDVTHYDNTITALITVFVIASMEGWTDVWNYINRTFKDKFGINPIIIFLYFHILLFVGGYYLINLYLAVIKTKFTIISKENRRKDQNMKRSFYDLIKAKYDKSKDKNNDRNLKQSKDLKEDEALRRLRLQTIFIKKNTTEIPMNYDTIKDLCLLRSLEPSELYNLNNRIRAESKTIENEYHKKVKNIKTISRTKTIYSKDSTPVLTTVSNRNSIATQKKHLSTLYQDENSFKILIDKFIEPALKETIKWFKNDILNLRKVQQKLNTEIKLKQSKKKDKELKNNKKKFLKKKNKLEISYQQDTSMEQDIKKILHEQTLKHEINIFPNSLNTNNMRYNNSTMAKTTIIMNKKEAQTNFTSPKNSRWPSEQPKQEIINIEDELSIFSDNSSEDIEESILDTNINHIRVNNLNLNRISTKLKVDNIPIATKKSLVDPKNQIFNSVTIKKPTSMMSEISRHNDELVWKKKIEIKRKNFNVDDYIAIVKPDQMNKIGRRNSYLKVLKYIEEKENYDEFFNLNFIGANSPSNFHQEDNLNKSLEISLFHDEILDFGEKSLTDLDILPAIVPLDEQFIEEIIDLDEVIKKNENNKFTRIARNSIFDNNKRNTVSLSAVQRKNIFKKINSKMNNNIVIDMKQPKAGIKRIMTRKNTIYSKKKSNIESLKPSPSISVLKDKFEKNQFHYKSTSVEKNYYKYPKLGNKEITVGDIETTNLIENTIREKKEQIPDHLRERRKYMNYLHNISDKDFKVQDVFKADYWREDVLGLTPKQIEQIEKPPERNPIFVFNDSSLKLKTYTYQRYRLFELLDDEYIHHNHQLKYLGSKAIQIFPPKPKSFGMIKSDKKSDMTVRSLSRTSIIRNTTNRSRMTNFGSSFHKNKSVIGKNSISSVSHNVVQDMMKAKKGVLDKLHRKLDNFNFKTLSHYFLEDERLIGKLTQKDEKKRIFISTY